MQAVFRLVERSFSWVLLRGRGSRQVCHGIGRTSESLHPEPAGVGGFTSALEEMVSSSSPITIEALSIFETVPSPLEYTLGSALPPQTSFDSATGRLHWSIPKPITDSAPITLTYEIRPHPDVLTPIVADFAGGTAVLTDMTGLTRTVLSATAPCGYRLRPPSPIAIGRSG